MPRRKKSSIGETKHNIHGGLHKGKPQQRNAANARERARMRVLSRAFCRLKTTLPWVPSDTKLSKLDTLRFASKYIAQLKEQVQQDDAGISTSENPNPTMTLTWPFGFNRPTAVEGNGSSPLLGDGGSEGEDGEENENSSSGCWEPESPIPGKDCVHLDEPSPDLLPGGRNNHKLSHFLHEDEYSCVDSSDNNNRLHYNVHHTSEQHHHHHHHHEQEQHSYAYHHHHHNVDNNFHSQQDVIMTIS